MERKTCLAVVLASLALSAPARPSDAAAKQPSAPVSAQGAGGAVDPEAMAALDRMGAFLRKLNAFQVQAAISRDDVLTDGQKVQFDSEANLVAARPNRLRMEVTSVQEQRFFFYDAKTFTLWAPRTNYYASVAAPPTIPELVDVLEAKYAIDMPLSDLFKWGTPESDSATIAAARDLGPSEVGGITCEHYAFRQPGLDWEIWIQNGDYPLPKKVVLTTTTDPARPDYSAVYTWNLAPSFDATAFTFVPPSDARRITFQEASRQPVSRNRGQP